MLLRVIPVGTLRTNCYLVASEGDRHALLIDPGADADRILRATADLAVAIDLIALTHSHYDHVMAAEEIRTRTGAPLAIHSAEARWLANPPGLLASMGPQNSPTISADRLLAGGDVLSVGGLTAQVLHTPGHSPGGVSIWIEADGVVFCGDVLFREGIGRTDLAGSNYADLVRSVREQLFALPPGTVVLPGHGPRTTIAHEQEYNPWLGA